MTRLFPASLVISLLLLLLITPVQAQTVVTLNPGTQYQTITGWEATSQAGEVDCASTFDNYKNSLFDQAVSDLGINRLRVELKATSSTSTSMDFTSFDDNMTRVVIPIRNRLLARGETLWLNVTFTGQSGFGSNRAAYASEVVRTYQHLHSTYGFLPDSWEIALEPGLVTNLGSYKIGDIIAQTEIALTSAGFTPYFIIPSSPGGLDTAVVNFNDTISSYYGWYPTYNNGAAAPGFPTSVKEFAYHRYANSSDTSFTSLQQFEAQDHIDGAQLEHGSGIHPELHQDLKQGNVSAWQEYALAYCANGDNGYKYYDVTSGSPVLGSRAQFLRQYFHFIRSGAIRIDAYTSSCAATSYCASAVDPVAFINANGAYVVVVKTPGAASLSLQGLPGNTYTIVYTTGTTGIDASGNPTATVTDYNHALANQTITSGQALNVSIPSSGVMTIIGQNASGPPPSPSATPTSIPGDYDADSDHDLIDLSLLTNVFGQTNATLNLVGTNLIDIFDFSHLLTLLGY